jgi:ArsR family transcriptional regulator
MQNGGIISVVNDMTKPNVSAVSQELLDFTKAIGSESRIQILLLFLDGQERTVNQITGAVGLGQPTTSEHLAIMKRAGILEAEKRGKEVYYRPDRIQIAHYLDVISDLLKKCC